jgi:dihydroneopterin aldolase
MAADREDDDLHDEDLEDDDEGFEDEEGDQTEVTIEIRGLSLYTHHGVTEA